MKKQGLQSSEITCYQKVETETEKMFMGYIVIRVKCMHCSFDTCTFDPLSDLLVSVDTDKHTPKANKPENEETIDENKPKENPNLLFGQVLAELSDGEEFDREEADGREDGERRFERFIRESKSLAKNGYHLLEIDREFPGSQGVVRPVKKASDNLLDFDGPIDFNSDADFGTIGQGGLEIPEVGIVGKAKENDLWTPEMYVKVPKSEALSIEMLLGFHFGSELLNNVDNGTECKNCQEANKKEEKENLDQNILDQNISESEAGDNLHFMTKTLRLYMPPPNLAITLKRFRYKKKGKNSTFSKINNHVKFPFTLDLTPYTLCKPSKLTFQSTRRSTRSIFTS